MLTSSYNFEFFYCVCNFTRLETKEEYAFENQISTPEKPSNKPTEGHPSNNSQVQLLTSNSIEKQPTNGGIQTEEETIYMNGTPTADIPVDKLESAIAERRAKGNELFKKEYAVRVFFLFYNKTTG